MAAGKPRSRNKCSKAAMVGVFAHRRERLAEQQIARGVIGDGERVAVLAVAQPELTFEIGAPEIAGCGTGGQLRALGTAAGAPLMADQPIAVEHGVNGADGRRLDVVGQSREEPFTQLAGAPVRFVLLETDDHGLELGWQPVGIAVRAT
jgi:hypothetical protein